MDGLTGGWWMDEGWVDGRVDGWVGGWRVDGCVDGSVGEWMGGWMYGLDEQMDTSVQEEGILNPYGYLNKF